MSNTAETLEIAPPASSRTDLARSPETAATASAAHATALVQARYVVALKNPRDMDAVREKLLKECRRPGFAAVARYVKPIGKGIVGPSIRFAEAAIRCMTNVNVQTTVLFDDREKRIVQVEVSDLEANVPYTSSVTIEKTVERRQKKPTDTVIRERVNSKGDLVYIIEATEDDILNKQNALVSKAIRTNALRLVPGDIIEECMDQVVVTQEKADAKDPDAAKRQVFDAFNALGIKTEDLKKWLGHDGTTLTPKEIADLRALHAAIKDGETSWREAMDAKAPATKQGLADAVDGKKGGV
jgi:hypothetical protein